MTQGKTSSLLVFALLLASPSPAKAAEISGVKFAESIEWNETPLRLNGAGVLRYRIFIKGYAAALYLGEGVPADQALADVPRRLELEYFWSIEAEGFARAGSEQIAANVDAETLARLQDSLDRLNALYEDVEPGDRYALTYVPGIGTELALNGEPKGLVEGAEFSAAVFSIWLGKHPIDESLREQLLTPL